MQTVRNGQKVWPTCPSCGCRLEVGTKTYGGYHHAIHFGALNTKGLVDARGCKCPLAKQLFKVHRDDLYRGVA